MHGQDNHRLQQVKESKRETHEQELPSYRFYGKTKRLRPWQEKTTLTLGRILVIWVLSILAFAVSLAVVCFWLYFPEMWIKVLLTVLIGILVLNRLTRTFRKRRNFYRQLKKLCKKQRYRLQYDQSFLRSMIWSAERQHLTIDTGTHLYSVRFMTIRKYRSTLYFEDPAIIRHVKRPLSNKFTVIFDSQPRSVYYPIDFDVHPARENRVHVKALIVNPVCAEMFYKKRDGGYEATGNGGEHYGYTVFTASGFLESVKRNEERAVHTTNVMH